MSVVGAQGRGYGLTGSPTPDGAVTTVAHPGQVQWPRTLRQSMGPQDHVEPDHDELKPRQDWEAETKSR